MRLFLVLMFPTLAMAQEVTFEMGPREIGLNESIRFKINIENPQEQGRRPSFPNNWDLGDFELARRNPSTAYQTNIVNGRVSTVESYTYIFRPKRKGQLRFPAQTVTYGGKTYRSEPVVIEVGEENRTIRRPRQDYDPFDPFRSNRRRPTEPQEVFAEIDVPKREYFIGEPIPLKVKLFRTFGVEIINHGSRMDLPDFQDFWVEELESEPIEVTARRDGKAYKVNTVDQRRLFANKTGEITIPPAAFTLRISPRRFFATTETVQRRTAPVELTIKPLPSEGRPAAFNGLVGNFRLEGSLDKSQVKAGESVTLKLEVTGNGNFSAISDLQPVGLENHFEVFEGGTPTVDKGRGGLTTKTWVFALVPKREGDYAVPVPQLAFFDLDSERYQMTRARDLPLVVTPGEGLAPGVTTADALPSFSAEQSLSFIKLDPLGDLTSHQELKPPIQLAYVLLGFTGLNLIAFLGLMAYNQGLQRRTQLRPQYAFRNFKRNVSALRAGDDPDLFYAGLSEATFGYFGDKWERPGQGISLDVIHDRFNRDGVPEDHYSKIEECIEACDLARFTPTTPSSREQLLEKTIATIRDIEEASR